MKVVNLRLRMVLVRVGPGPNCTGIGVEGAATFKRMKGPIRPMNF